VWTNFVGESSDQEMPFIYAFRALKGNTSALRREVDEMRAAFRCRDLDCFVEHDVAFHRHILQASQNQTLVRV
jgi:DNA-binding GntR family transcriptional regulator